MIKHKKMKSFSLYCLWYIDIKEQCNDLIQVIKSCIVQIFWLSSSWPWPWPTWSLTNPVLEQLLFSTWLHQTHWSQGHHGHLVHRWIISYCFFDLRDAFKKKIAEKETLVHMGGRGVKIRQFRHLFSKCKANADGRGSFRTKKSPEWDQIWHRRKNLLKGT